MVGDAVNGAAMGDLLAALRAVAEPTRLRLLVLCARGELTVSELAQSLGQSQPRVSRHLKLLCEAGLLDRFREGSWVFYRLSACSAAGALSRHLVAACGEANVGVCLDVFHYYTGPSKFEDLGYLTKSNLFHVQLCDLADVPRELAKDSHRVLPGEGDIHLTPLIEHLRRIDYRGCLSIELMNPHLWQVPALQLADAAMASLQRILEPARL
jgi:DNA-binding transcriptional ArsR family regulator